MKMKNLPLKLLLSILALIIVSNGYSQCPAGMISYWRLQESEGPTFVDEKDNHNGLAGTSAPLQTAGISGNAQLFNGSSFISVPSHADFNWTAAGSFSIELWVKTTAASGNQVFIGRDDPSTSNLTTHWWIGVTALGKINWYTRASDGSNGVVTTSVSYNNDVWHHIVAVRDGALQKHFLYVDGILQNTGGTPVTLTADLSTTSDITIGNMVFNMTPTYFFNGAIDEVAVYNRVLTESEITGDYTAMRDYGIGYCSGNSPEILTSPDTTAIINQPYTYDVSASGNPAPTYSLVQGPENMTIAAGTGVISWLPTSFSQNVPVIVRATNSNGSVDQSFNIFLGDVPVCRDNLIAYWNFDNAGGSPYIDNIGGYNLTGINPSQVTGLIDKALLFDGVNDSLNLKDDVEPAKIFFDFDDVPSFSIELWMKSSATPSQTMVLVGRDEESNNSQFWLGVLTTGEVGFFVRDYIPTPNSASLKGGSVLDGEWHHVVATLNATSDAIRLYVDKILVDEVTQNVSNLGGNNALNIGCLNMTGEKYWYNGLLDELAFYNTPLTEADIINNNNAVVAGSGACSSNFAPLITTVPDSTVDEDLPFYYKIMADDFNPSDTMGIYVVEKPSWVTFTYNRKANYAVLSGTPDNSMVGKHPVNLRVSDGLIDVEQSFNITVANINDAPAITSIPVSSVNEDELYSYQIIGNDIDAGSTLTYTSASTNPDWLTLDPITHVLSGIPSNDDVGVFSITVSVSDGIAPRVDQTYQLTVNNVNDLPEITSTPIETAQANSLYMYELTATDVDEGDVLSFASQTIPAWLTFTPGSTSGILTGTPTEADLGPYALILKVSDGHADVLQAFTITVTAASAIDNVDNSIVNSVYPIPANEKVYFKLAEKGETKVEIFDLSGSLQKQIVVDNEEIIDIDISTLSTGVYLYKVFQNNKIGMGKITKN